ncbi:MAG: hypothetical protein HOQ24_10135 [Mycobacteriaceae bacterium]|nr:hypothetical protein [Mycobacteriaceae bacterium]
MFILTPTPDKECSVRIKPIVAAAAVVAAAALTACGTSESPSQPAMSSPAMSSPAMASPTVADSGMTAMATGRFGGLNGKHVAGDATVGNMGVTLANFSSDEGPDLHIYLTNGASESDVAAGREIGAIKHNVVSQTFALNGIHARDYHMVVIHCDKAKAVFGAASLR